MKYVQVSEYTHRLDIDFSAELWFRSHSQTFTQDELHGMFSHLGYVVVVDMEYADDGSFT